MTEADALVRYKSLADMRMLQLAELAHVTRLSSLGELVSALSHELNQPLAAIVNYVEASKRELRAGGVDESRIIEDLEQIGNQAVRAAEIVRRTRSLAPQEQPRKEPASLAALALDVLTHLDPSARRNGVTVLCSMEKSLPWVEVDRIQIQQVVFHMALNGIEAVAETDAHRRRLMVRTRRGPDGSVELAMMNTGPRLDPEVANRVFDPLFTTKESGMGLGLSVARRIIDAHGGRMWSTPGIDWPDGGDAEEGATFAFCLPALAEEACDA